MPDFGGDSQYSLKVTLIIIAHLWTICFSETTIPDIKDSTTGLCPSGYPKLVVHNKTGKCYPVGEQGPCGTLMIIVSDHHNPNYGICKCQYDGRDCVSRPLVKWPSEDRCYYAFEQGPCGPGEWLNFNQSRDGICEKNVCRQAKLEGNIGSGERVEPEIPIETFWFAVNGTCYQTGTKAFCDKNNNQVVYYVADKLEPQCVENPVSCTTIDVTEPRGEVLDP